MNKKSKFFTLILSTLLLTGCDLINSNSKSDISSSSEDIGDVNLEEEFNILGYDGSEVEVDFYLAVGHELSQMLNKYIGKFNQTFPNITINLKRFNDYSLLKDQLTEDLKNDKQPAMALIDKDDVAQYMDFNRSVNLDRFIDDTCTYYYTGPDGNMFDYTLSLDENQKNDFVETYYNASKQYEDGKRYSIAYSKTNDVFYYNKTKFEAMNLPIPSTWDDVWEACEFFKYHDPQCIPFGYDDSSSFFITMAKQMGSDYTSLMGDHFVFDNNKNRDFVNSLVDKYHKGYFTTKSLLGKYTSTLFTSTGSGQGVRSYMSIGSASAADYYLPRADENNNIPFEVGVAPIPQFDKTHPSVLSSGKEITLFKQTHSNVVNAAWLFTKYLTTNVDFQTEHAINLHHLPTLKSALKSKQYQDYLARADGRGNVLSQALKVSYEQLPSYFETPSFKNSDVAKKAVGNIIDTVVSNKISLNEAFNDALNKCHNIKKD